MKVILIISRAIGFAVIFFFLFLTISELVSALQQEDFVLTFSWKLITYYFIIIMSAMSYFLAWRHEGFGGLFLTICGVALSFVSDWRLGLPIFIVGQLFVLYWYLWKARRVKPRPKQMVQPITEKGNS